MESTNPQIDFILFQFVCAYKQSPGLCVLRLARESENGQMTLTTLCVCVCPTRINILEQMIDKQKLSRIMERSERMYLREEEDVKM